MELLSHLKKQDEERTPMFECAICLTEHEVEGCCTLPCHLCFDSLQYHFDIVVRERRLERLVCPVVGCAFDLRFTEHIQILQECLTEVSYHRLLDFFAREWCAP